MALTAEQIQAKIASLETELSSADASQHFADRSRTAKSVDEIKRQLDYWRGQLAVTSGSGSGRVSQIRMIGSSGY